MDCPTTASQVDNTTTKSQAPQTSVRVHVPSIARFTPEIKALEQAILAAGQSVSLWSDGYDRGEEGVMLWLYASSDCASIIPALKTARDDWSRVNNGAEVLLNVC